MAPEEPRPWLLRSSDPGSSGAPTQAPQEPQPWLLRSPDPGP